MRRVPEPTRPGVTRPVRIAVIGAGVIGRLHATLVAAGSDSQLVAIADPAPGAADLAAELGVAWYADHDTLLAQERIDGAIIAVPTGQHARVGIDCVAAGVHILVEKPIAADLVQADELATLAEKGNLVLQVGHLERFSAAYRALSARTRAPLYIEDRKSVV